MSLEKQQLELCTKFAHQLASSKEFSHSFFLVITKTLSFVVLNLVGKPNSLFPLFSASH